MRNEEDQIEALLVGAIGDWALEQLDTPDFSNVDFHDFFSVTPERVVAHVLARGFPHGAVWAPGQPPTEKNGRLVVEPAGAGWAVYFADMGDRDRERVHARYEDAVADVVARLFDDAWVTLNHRYWHAHHPELDTLPPFGAPWPTPKAPRA